MRASPAVVLVLFTLLPLPSLGAPPPPPPVASLTARLDDPDPYVRRAAAGALVEQGDAAIAALARAEQAGSPAQRDLAHGVGLAIATAKRLKAQPQTEVPFWMDLEAALAIEPAAVRHAALLAALGKEWTIDEARSRLEAGRRTAMEFCAAWTDMPGAGAEASNRAQEEALLRAGPTAAPYLLALLAAESDPSFRVQILGPRAGRDFVIAMHAVRILKLRAAVPHLVRWVNGTSAWAHGVALQTLQALVGQDFGSLISLSLEEAESRVLAWWSRSRGEFGRSTGWLVRAKLSEIHEVLAAQEIGAADRKGDLRPWDEGSYEELATERLRKIAGDDLPLALEGDVAARLAAVRAAQAWAEERFAR